MLIAYCDTCGFRIPESDFASGAATKLDENRFICAKCNAGAAAQPKPAPKINMRISGEIKRPSPAFGTRTVVPARPPSGNTRQIQQPQSGSTRAAGANNSVKWIVISGVAAAVVLLLVLLSGKEKPAESAAAEKPAPPPLPPAKQQPVAATPKVQPDAPAAPKTETPEDRRRKADKDLEDMRAERAMKILNEHKAWFAQHSYDPWEYKERLANLAGSYRSTPAGDEAAKLIAEVKIPGGEQSPDSMVWQRDWEITPDAKTTMLESFDHHRFVLHTHPASPGKPCVLKRKFKVPGDKALLEFNVRAHEQGDFKLIVKVEGKTQIEEVLGGPPWRTFALDLSALKGKEAEISIQHHNTDWNNEHGWLQAPRFVDRPSGSAKIVVYGGAAPSPPATTAQNKAWRVMFDGKSLDKFVSQALEGWKLENGVLSNLAGSRNASKIRAEMADGEIRVRFEVSGGSYMHFTARQGEAGGYSANFDRSSLPQMAGKTHELLFVLRGDDVTATLDGQPKTLQATGKPRSGQLQFSIAEGILHILSIEFGDLGASSK